VGMFNPSAFKNKIGFLYYNKDMESMKREIVSAAYKIFYQPILEKYYTKIINLFPLSPKQSADYIINQIRIYG